MSTVGRRNARVPELVRLEDRISFLYLERCVINRAGNALTATTVEGVVHIPMAAVSCVLVGPGASVTHAAMALMADSASTMVWVGEAGVRYYAHGQGLSTRTALLERQAAVVSHQRRRLDLARRMYGRRFPGEDVTRASMQQLRGREGARVRRLYREEAARTGVPWTGRSYDPNDFAGGDPVNRSLSAANHALYGVVHAAVVAMGCSPHLGVVHTGHTQSFVHDLADLYKAEFTIPLAFDVAADADPDDEVEGLVRRRFRDLQKDGNLLSRCARDLKDLLMPGEELDDPVLGGQVIYLWDENQEPVAGGRLQDVVPW
ncbi:CRISPR-associated protein, Cas1 family [Kytococcus aerolatus]|uniref:CRISPR-associated endonuclease Cas1 n=1 Tax=Kytococcus aerolatus TaxID=592308 RepID=A0A212U5E9_9MICO|nr:CRISPR-associated protein, Cas1 family [Kytococcus aerolatus]